MSIDSANYRNWDDAPPTKRPENECLICELTHCDCCSSPMADQESKWKKLKEFPEDVLKIWRRKELPEDVLKIIRAFSKPHASLKLLNDATRVIDSCYWKALRQSLIIGRFAGEVFIALKTFMDNNAFMETSQRSLHFYEDSIGVPRLPYYGVMDIRQVWVPETDHIPNLTYEEKLQLVHEMYQYIQAQMDEDISFILLKIKICEDAEAADKIEDCYEDEDDDEDEDEDEDDDEDEDEET